MATMAGPSILVVDDERATREVLTEFLDLEGFVVTPAAGARLALRFLENGGEPDVILLDIRMREMSGRTFLADLARRGLAARSRIVILSGERFDPPFESALRQVSRILLKPVSADFLVPALHLEAAGGATSEATVCEHCPAPAAWEARVDDGRIGRVVRFCEAHISMARGASAVRSFARLGTRPSPGTDLRATR